MEKIEYLTVLWIELVHRIIHLGVYGYDCMPLRQKLDSFSLLYHYQMHKYASPSITKLPYKFVVFILFYNS